MSDRNQARSARRSVGCIYAEVVAGSKLTAATKCGYACLCNAQRGPLLDPFFSRSLVSPALTHRQKRSK